MSKIIKASQITGEFRIEETNYLKSKKESQEEEKNKVVVEENSNNSSIDEITEDEENLKEEILAEAEKKAAEIIKEAEDTAKELKEQATKELETAQKEGYQTGYREGLAKGTDEGRKNGLAEFEQLIIDFEEIFSKTKEELDENIDNLSQDVISLAIKIGEKILNTELKINPAVINGIIKELLKELTDIDELNIYINPALLEVIDQESFKSEYAKNTIKFFPDKKLSAGDCIIETNFGSKDATINNKLANLEKELLKGAGFYEEN